MVCIMIVFLALDIDHWGIFYTMVDFFHPDNNQVDKSMYKYMDHPRCRNQRQQGVCKLEERTVELTAVYTNTLADNEDHTLHSHLLSDRLHKSRNTSECQTAL